MLHTLNKSPNASNSFDSCLRFMQSGDALLLYEDGVYAALAQTQVAARLQQCLLQCEVYVLAQDLAMRGLHDKTLVAGIKVIDYTGFVNLSIQHTNNQAW